MEKTEFYTVKELNEMGHLKPSKESIESGKQLSFFSLSDLMKMGSVGKAFGVIPIEVKLAPVAECDLPPIVMENQMAMSLHVRPTVKKSVNGNRKRIS